MYENELKRILDASQNNALSFFVGAGVSALSNAPTWKALIDSICVKLGREKKDSYSSDEYLQIPQMLYYSLGENKSEYNRFVNEQLHSADLKPNDIHHEMLELNPVSFITTNYDTLIEDSALQHCKSYKAVACDGNVPKIYGDRFILKVHGDFSNNNFVLKEEDYLNYSENFKLIETLTKSIFSTNTVVFIGYGLNDYNIKLIVNWAKSLLKDNFLEPIFIYTDDHKLSKEELIYHKSKGLSVIEWYQLVSHSDEYLPRYKAFFDALKKLSKSSPEGKTEDEAFEILYNLLKPLNKLYALRKGDVSKRIPSRVRIADDGVVHLSKDDVILKKFFDINQMTEDQKNSLEEDVLDKYYCILEVFKKARILEVEDGHKYRHFIENAPFADRNCIQFDYTSMCEFCAKKYSSIEKNYKKAFYLSRLKRYDEAFFLFSDVAKQAFKDNNYLFYYLAESNCISLRTIIRNANQWYRCYDLSQIESLSPNDLEVENLFRRLPVEFRNTYENLKDIHSSNMLYRYSYEAFIDGQKLQNAIDSRSTEFGLTSSGKAICKINDYLHFLQGNGIIAEVFTEYKSTVKNLMSLLVYKYSSQSKKVLHDKPFPFEGGDIIHFDEIDFYCFIDCFSDKEIRALFTKHHIETIGFENMDRVETSVNNLLDYYDYAVKHSKNNVDVLGLQTQIKNCVSLLRYINISQGLVDKVVKFILTHEFRDFFINDKVIFIDSQLKRRKMYSDLTAKTIEDTLISYIDKHIAAVESGEQFDLPSTSSGINYFSLVHFIFPSEDEHVSRRLSMRVSKILKKKLTPMYSQITKHYFEYVSTYQKKRLLSWANKQIVSSFNFDLFTMLVMCDARISLTAKKQLKLFLKNKIELEKVNESSSKGMVVYPINKPFEELDQVGYWCLIKVLRAKDFKEFIGNSPAFDFYCQYAKFDFNRFEVSWLLNLYPHTLTEIAKNKTVKDKIRNAIADELKNKSLVEADAERLQSILIEHFC